MRKIPKEKLRTVAPVLNSEQARAVELTEGPVLVISGAGTGKTRVLTEKILSLIHDRGVRAENILALTFTEKAADEMAGRVEAGQPLGSEEVMIRTFHAFADSVLRERGHEIGLPLDYRIFQPVDLWGFLKKHLPDLSLEYYRPLASPERFLRSLQEYFSRLQDEDITPQQYETWADRMSVSAAIPEEKEHALRHLELARAYGAYLDLLVKNGSLDFGSLIYYTLRLFTQRPSVLAEYKKRFSHILVDEFQDTNFAQNKLVTLLAAPGGNITVVGDDDQAIYKWRGASLTNIQFFQKTFPKAASIVLDANYRSTQPILDLAYAVIQKNNPHRLEVQHGVSKKLLAAGPPIQAKLDGKAALLGVPEVRHFSSVQDEIVFIAESSERNLRQGRDTAILVRTNALAAGFIERFQKENIPLQNFSPSLLFSSKPVKDCLAVIRVAADPWDDQAFFRALSLPMWNIPMKKLLEALHESKRASRPLLEMISESFEKTGETFEHLVEFSRKKPVSQVLSEFMKLANYPDYLKSSESNEALEDLAAFSEKIRAFEDTHEEKTVVDFLAYARLLEEAGESRNEKVPFDPDAVKILTIHAAKGLEFDAVFLPGLVSGKFPTYHRRDPFEIPAELIPEPLPGGDHYIEEERRLFYVACTRAKSSLTLTYSDFYDGKKQWKPSAFVLEALESGKAALALPRSGKRTPISSRRPPLKSQQSLAFAEPNEKRLILNLPKLSYSRLDAFRTCPLKYQFRYLWSVPAELPSVVYFGTSIHNTLKDFYAHLQKHPETSVTELKKALSEAYEKNWVPSGYDSRSAEQDQKKAGKKMLDAFFKRDILSVDASARAVPAFLEKSFKLELGEITLSGRIDRIDRLADGTYEVIDYKTGSAKEKNLSKDLQLSIYALACREALKIPVSRLSLYFLDGLEKVSTTRSSADLDECRNEIVELAKELAASDFSATPGFHCRYCDYRLVCPAATSILV